MEKKLTDEEIVKALECSVGERTIDCESCPLNEDNFCSDWLIEISSLDLIRRLQEDNKRLTDTLNQYINGELINADTMGKIISLEKQADEYFTKADYYYQKCKAYGIEFFYDDEFEAKHAKEGKTITFPKFK